MNDPVFEAPSIGPKPPGAHDAQITLWKEAYRNGEGLTLTNQQSPYVGDRFNDQISSIQVYSGRWRVFIDKDYGGGSIELGPGQYYANLENSPWQDSISSVRLESYI